MQTWTCIPQVISRRPTACRSRASPMYRSCGVDCWSSHFADGWVDAATSASPSVSAHRATVPRSRRRSSRTSPIVSQTSVLTSTWDCWNSVLTWAPRLATHCSITAVGVVRINCRLSRSTRRYSSSTPTVKFFAPATMPGPPVVPGVPRGGPARARPDCREPGGPAPGRMHLTDQADRGSRAARGRGRRTAGPGYASGAPGASSAPSMAARTRSSHGAASATPETSETNSWPRAAALSA